MNTLKDLLNNIADYFIYDLIGLSEGLWYTEALHYFLTGFSQIFLLLVLIIYLMNIITSYLSMDKIKVFLERNKKTGFGNILAAALGAVTPFCSCSSIPLFIGMMQARVSLGISLSFLITSPLINEVAIALFWVSFGWEVALTYILSGIFLGVVGGILLDKLGLSKYVADWIKDLEYRETKVQNINITFAERIPQIHALAFNTIKQLTPYIFLGLAIGSFIHGYVPESFFQEYIGKENPFAVPIAVILAIALYIDAVGVLPVIDSLIGKGVPMGTAIAFMMGTIGLSLPEALMLKKVMKKRLIISFFATVGVGMILSGYFFNLLFS